MDESGEGGRGASHLERDCSCDAAWDSSATQRAPRQRALSASQRFHALSSTDLEHMDALAICGVDPRSETQRNASTSKFPIALPSGIGTALPICRAMAVRDPANR